MPKAPSNPAPISSWLTGDNVSTNSFYDKVFKKANGSPINNRGLENLCRNESIPINKVDVLLDYYTGINDRDLQKSVTCPYRSSSSKNCNETRIMLNDGTIAVFQHPIAKQRRSVEFASSPLETERKKDSEPFKIKKSIIKHKPIPAKQVNWGTYTPRTANRRIRIIGVDSIVTLIKCILKLILIPLRFIYYFILTPLQRILFFILRQLQYIFCFIPTRLKRILHIILTQLNSNLYIIRQHQLSFGIFILPILIYLLSRFSDAAVSFCILKFVHMFSSTLGITNVMEWKHQYKLPLNILFRCTSLVILSILCDFIFGKPKLFKTEPKFLTTHFISISPTDGYSSESDEEEEEIDVYEYKRRFTI